MRVLTYNVWHGLTSGSHLFPKSLEPNSRVRWRQELQLHLLKELQADVLLLQELKPLHKRATFLKQSLKKEGFCQKNVPGLWNSGLCTMVPSEWTTEDCWAVKMSGSGRSFATAKTSLRTGQSHYALLVETLVADIGRILWVNVHLQSGTVVSPELTKSVDQLVKGEVISATVQEELMARLKTGMERREQEVQHLLKVLASQQNRYNLIVLAGTFNAPSESVMIENIQNAGYQNLTKDLNTWDPSSNFANHIFLRDFIPLLAVEDLSFDPKVRASIKDLVQSYYFQTRQIDYIFGYCQNGLLNSQTKIVGFPSGDSPAPSDHFGILLDLSWTSRC